MARRSEITTPKLAYPFRLSATGRHACIVEADSEDDIMGCLEVLLLTEKGSRSEVPEYGIADQVFRQGGISRDEILAAIRMWEARAEVVLSTGDIEDLVQRATIHYLGGTNA